VDTESDSMLQNGMGLARETTLRLYWVCRGTRFVTCVWEQEFK